MVHTILVLEIGYPYGISIYEVSYQWSELPIDHSIDHVDYVTAICSREIGRGEWLVGPLLHEGLWRGLYCSFQFQPPMQPPMPAIEIPD